MHTVTNVCVKYIYEVVYDLSVDLVTFDLGLPLKVKSRSQTFQGAVSHLMVHRMTKVGMKYI